MKLYLRLFCVWRGLVKRSPKVEMILIRRYEDDRLACQQINISSSISRSSSLKASAMQLERECYKE